LSNAWEQELIEKISKWQKEMAHKIEVLESEKQELIKILISNEEKWKLILLKYEDRLIESQDENEIKKIMRLQKNDLLERYNVFIKQLKQLEEI